MTDTEPVTAYNRSVDILKALALDIDPSTTPPTPEDLAAWIGGGCPEAALNAAGNLRAELAYRAGSNNSTIPQGIWRLDAATVTPDLGIGLGFVASGIGQRWRGKPMEPDADSAGWLSFSVWSGVGESWQLRLVDSLNGIAEDWNALPQPRPDFPLLPVIQAWQARPRTPDQAIVVTAGNDRLTRYPARAATAALADLCPSGQTPEVRTVSVDGQPIASPEPIMRPRKPQLQHGGEKLILPGQVEAEALIIQRMRYLERAGTDRRSPLPGDTFALLNLGAALTRPMQVSVGQVGAWLTGRANTKGMTPAQIEALVARAWAALDAARAWFWLPSGNPLALLDVDIVGLPEGELIIKPWNWADYQGQWRLSGAVANLRLRQGLGNGRGRPVQLPRLLAGMEDFIYASGSPGDADRRPRLLIPESKGGPGPMVTVGYPVLLTRSGWVFDWKNRADIQKAAHIWRRLIETLVGSKYCAPTLRGEAEAGDTVELINVTAGQAGQPGKVTFRASARYVAALAQVTERQRRSRGGSKRKGKYHTAKRRDDGLDRTPLATLMPRT